MKEKRIADQGGQVQSQLKDGIYTIKRYGIKDEKGSCYFFNSAYQYLGCKVKVVNGNVYYEERKIGELQKV